MDRFQLKFDLLDGDLQESFMTIELSVANLFEDALSLTIDLKWARSVISLESWVDRKQFRDYIESSIKTPSHLAVNDTDHQFELYFGVDDSAQRVRVTSRARFFWELAHADHGMGPPLQLSIDALFIPLDEYTKIRHALIELLPYCL